MLNRKQERGREVKLERTEAGGQERGRGSGKAREHGEKEGGRL